jgi:hypothetical protein
MTPKTSSGSKAPTPAEWLTQFEYLTEQHLLDGEPDWIDALALFRAAVVRGDPNPFEWRWCAECYERASKGRPPVTVAEFEDLTAWYERNQGTILASRRDWYPFTNALPTKSPRDSEVTKYVERLRELRAQFADLD